MIIPHTRRAKVQLKNRISKSWTPLIFLSNCWPSKGINKQMPTNCIQDYPTNYEAILQTTVVRVLAKIWIQVQINYKLYMNSRSTCKIAMARVWIILLFQITNYFSCQKVVKQFSLISGIIRLTSKRGGSIHDK